MRIYVILLLAATLLLGLSCLAAYLATARRNARKRQAVAARLDAVVAQAEVERNQRRAAAKASAALTAVLPAIKQDERAPRRLSDSARAVPARRAYTSGVSQRTDIGGRTIVADAGRPCHGLGIACTVPRLPRPLPP
jgi:hypothetical protein